MVFLLIGITIGLTVAGQLLLKAGLLETGALPQELGNIPTFLVGALTNAKVAGGLLLAFFAALAWIGAVSLSAISFAYPFMALAIVLTLALSGVVFGEQVPLSRWLGVAVVCLGLILAARER
jgi:drug/metabolite transporter (DMT)-like permease